MGPDVVWVNTVQTGRVVVFSLHESDSAIPKATLDCEHVRVCEGVCVRVCKCKEVDSEWIGTSMSMCVRVCVSVSVCASARELIASGYARV